MQSLHINPWNMSSNQRSNQQNLSSSPVRALSQMNRNIEQMMDQFFNMMPMPGMQIAEQMLPNVDIDERSDCYVMELSIPGLRQEDLELNVRNGALHFSASGQSRNNQSSSDRNNNESRSDNRNSRSDRSQRGSNVTQLFQSSMFQYSMALPMDADESNVEAEFDNGTLCITVQKLERSKADETRIEIKTAQGGQRDNASNSARNDRDNAQRNESASGNASSNNNSSAKSTQRRAS